MDTAPVSQNDRRLNRVICLPFPEEQYLRLVQDPQLFRKHLNKVFAQFPELFPQEMTAGYQMKDLRQSKKQQLPLRRITINRVPYTIRPSFLLPYMSGQVDQADSALFLRRFDVPFWALARVFGRDEQYWYRLCHSLGRNSLVGTTIRDPQRLPAHLNVDEKHSWNQGQKVYIATTVTQSCFLGMAVAPEASEVALQQAYGKFREEAQQVCRTYQPQTVTTDGWEATQKAWKTLFPKTVLILCFLHVFIKIRDRSQKKYKEAFQSVATRLWECYQATTKASFSQRVRRLQEWATQQNLPDVILTPLSKLRERLSTYAVAYDHPQAYRTSTPLDRLMQRMNQHLCDTHYLHGDSDVAEQNLRGWALLYNFAPAHPATIKQHQGWQSPAERLNQFRYHDHWLQNLLISASLGGLRFAPPNPS